MEALGIPHCAKIQQWKSVYQLPFWAIVRQKVQVSAIYCGSDREEERKNVGESPATSVQSTVPFVMRLNILLSKVLIGFHLTLIIFFLSVFCVLTATPAAEKKLPVITAIDGDFVKLTVLRSSIVENIIGS